MPDYLETPVIAIKGSDTLLTPGLLNVYKNGKTRESRLVYKLNEYCICITGNTYIDGVNAHEIYKLPTSPSELCHNTYCGDIAIQDREKCYLIHLSFDSKEQKWVEDLETGEHFRSGDVYFCTCGKRDREFGCVEGGTSVEKILDESR